MHEDLEQEVINQLPKVAQQLIEENNVVVKVIQPIRLVQFVVDNKKATVHFNQLHKQEIVMNRLKAVVGE